MLVTALAEEVGLDSIGHGCFGAAYRRRGYLSQRRLIHLVASTPRAGTLDSHSHIEDVRPESFRPDEFGRGLIEFLGRDVFEGTVLVLITGCEVSVDVVASRDIVSSGRVRSIPGFIRSILLWLRSTAMTILPTPIKGSPWRHSRRP